MLKLQEDFGNGGFGRRGPKPGVQSKGTAYELKDKLRIVPGLHALERMEQRRINYKDVIENLSNPVKLYFAKKEDSRRAGEEKYKCYFGISGQQVHVYVIVINPEKKLIKILQCIKIDRGYRGSCTMAKVECSYDYGEDLFYLRQRDQKSYGSVELGSDIVIDLDNKLNIVALEFFNASRVLGDLVGRRVSKKLLREVKNADFYTMKRGGLVLVVFRLEVSNVRLEGRLNMQDIGYKSPVLAR